MIRIDGECYITQKSLEKLLGVSGVTIRRTFSNRRDEFDGLSVDSMNAREFIRDHKDLLGVKRVRSDMHLWSKHDMLAFTMILRGKRGRELRDELIRFIEENAKYDTVSKDEYSAALEQVSSMRRQLDQLREEVEMIKPLLKEWAKISGQSLRVQSETKRIRSLN